MTAAAEIVDAAREKTGQLHPVDQRKTMRDKLLDRAQLAQLPEPEPLIAGTLDRRTMALLAGYWGTLKSFIALDWAASIATGTDWQGRQVLQGPVLYVAAEGAYGLDQRLKAWEFAWQTSIDPATFTVYPEKVDLIDKGAVRDLVQLCTAERYALVVLDTIARCIPGADENSAKDMGLVVDAMDQVKRALDGGTVLGVHHTGKDRTTTRGSSSLEAGLDTVYKTDGDPVLLALTRDKRKDGPREDRHSLHLELVLQSGVIAARSVENLSAARADMTTREADLMSAFVRDFADTGATKKELRDAAELPNATYSRALNALVSRGALRNIATPQRPFYTLGDSQ